MSSIQKENNKPKKSSQHIAIIYSLRGLSIILISFYHFGYNGIIQFDNELLSNIFRFGRKGIHIFFLISGIVIPLSLISYEYKIHQFWNYLLKRIIRIEPPYLVVLTLSVLYLYGQYLLGFTNDLNVLPSTKEIALHIGYLVPFSNEAEWIVPVFWTLSIEFQYYLFLAILFPLALSNTKILNWVFNLTVIMLPLTYSGTDLFLHWSAFFGLGIFYILYSFKKYSLIESCILLVLSAYVICTEQSVLDFFIGIIILLIVHFYPNLKLRLGMFLGKISYSYYLLHTIIGVTILENIYHLLSSDVIRIIAIILTITFIVFVSTFFWKYIERPSELQSKKVKMKQ